MLVEESALSLPHVEAPLAFVPLGSFSVDDFTVSMALALHELSLVDCAVWVDALSLSRDLAIL